MKRKNLRWNVMEFKTNYNKDNVIFIISEIFSKNLVIWRMFKRKKKILENKI